MIRPVLTVLHRWVGLAIAVFLVFSGLTGAVISWDHELDDWLNPHLMHTDSTGSARDSLELARAIEARDPRARVTFVPLVPEAGETLGFGISPRVDPETGRLYDLGYNQVFVDPVTGEERGRREWGAAWPVTQETLISFLYRLHYTLHLPEMWGTDRWGIWLMGIVALVWTLDCFVGFYLTLPARRAADSGKPSQGFWQRWVPAWKIKTSGTAGRINYDIHRAFGLWTWVLLFMLAFTGFSMNLYAEVFYPVMSKISKVTPGPFDLRAPTALHKPVAPKLDYAAIIPRAMAEAEKQKWDRPVGDVFYAQNFGIYGVRFFHPEEDHGVGGVGHATLYFDEKDGRYLGSRKPWTGTMADLFVQAQFPLHSGRILGIPGRILVSVMGLITTIVTITGVVIWYRKRSSPAEAQRAEFLSDRVPALSEKKLES